MAKSKNKFSVLTLEEAKECYHKLTAEQIREEFLTEELFGMVLAFIMNYLHLEPQTKVFATIGNAMIGEAEPFTNDVQLGSITTTNEYQERMIVYMRNLGNAFGKIEVLTKEEIGKDIEEFFFYYWKIIEMLILSKLAFGSYLHLQTKEEENQEYNEINQFYNGIKTFDEFEERFLIIKYARVKTSMTRFYEAMREGNEMHASQREVNSKKEKVIVGDFGKRKEEEES